MLATAELKATSFTTRTRWVSREQWDRCQSSSHSAWSWLIKVDQRCFVQFVDKQLSFCLLPHSFLWSRMTALRNFALQPFFGPTHAIPCEPQWEVRKCSPVFLYSPAAQAVIVISDAPRKQEKVAAAFNTGRVYYFTNSVEPSLCLLFLEDAASLLQFLPINAQYMPRFLRKGHVSVRDVLSSLAQT